MNTVKSFWYGWGALIVAGGGAYYMAKRSINEDRQARFDKDQRRRRMTSSLEQNSVDSAGRVNSDASGSPSRDASGRNTPGNEQKVAEKSKYETSEPFRSKKGDRLS
ncbi:hypothetical protein GP486_003884 [Trichoglossum hirsutum]|uniref:Uncharacterized protein n=1 Tax=Trichoglossum hirsutum TaxID=265104 RepID=A0A9P8LC93_9PEZI|nr:hypothetical protein GP486_003884 [Trichoglossum hirsutum]